jgi:hypothetical protein
MTAHAYTKVYRSITQSTVWVGQPAHVKLAWIVMLAEADEIGRVTTPVPVLAKLAEVTLPEFEEALSVFLSPDPYSRSKEYEGRRVEALSDEEEFSGFRILNHEKYRQKRDAEKRKEQNREAQARWREKHPDGARKPEVSQGVSDHKQDKPRSAEVSHKKPIPSASPSVANPDPVLPEEVDPRPDRDPARAADPPSAPRPEPVATVARRVFEAWKLDTGHARAVLDAKRQRRIEARLREGFTERDLLDALEGRHSDPWLMGTDPKSPRLFDEIDTLFRDAAQVEKLRDLRRCPGGAAGRAGTDEFEDLRREGVL